MSRALALALVLGSCAAGCSLSETERKAVRDVVTLRRGTISDLRAQRLTGPFHRYEVPPEEMMRVAADAVRTARDFRGRPAKVRESVRYREVVAKESAAEAPPIPSYSDEWTTAVVVTVHDVPGEPEASRVEWHSARRSVLMGGVTDWERSLPGWIDEVLAKRARGGDGVPGVEPLPETIDLSTANDRFRARWNEVLALRDLVPPPPAPPAADAGPAAPADPSDGARRARYRADLAAYARAADAYREAMDDFRDGLEFAREWQRLAPPAPEPATCAR